MPATQATSVHSSTVSCMAGMSSNDKAQWCALVDTAGMTIIIVDPPVLLFVYRVASALI